MNYYLLIPLLLSIIIIILILRLKSKQKILEKTIFEKHTSIHQFAIYRDWFKFIYGDYESDGTGVMDVMNPLNKEIAYCHNEIEKNYLFEVLL